MALVFRRNDPNHGVECPICGSVDSSVKETRREKGQIARRRQCDSGHKFWTEERVIGDHEKSAPQGA